MEKYTFHRQYKQFFLIYSALTAAAALVCLTLLWVTLEAANASVSFGGWNALMMVFTTSGFTLNISCICSVVLVSISCFCNSLTNSVFLSHYCVPLILGQKLKTLKNKKTKTGITPPEQELMISHVSYFFSTIPLRAIKGGTLHRCYDSVIIAPLCENKLALWRRHTDPTVCHM